MHMSEQYFLQLTESSPEPEIQPPVAKKWQHGVGTLKLLAVY